MKKLLQRPDEARDVDVTDALNLPDLRAVWLHDATKAFEPAVLVDGALRGVRAPRLERRGSLLARARAPSAVEEQQQIASLE